MTRSIAVWTVDARWWRIEYLDAQGVSLGIVRFRRRFRFRQAQRGRCQAPTGTPVMQRRRPLLVRVIGGFRWLAGSEATV